MARQILGKVVPTGEDTYDNSRTYNELCIVMYNGQSYISKKETKGNKPDNTEYWQQLVEKPVKGTDYFTEADKDEIVNDVTEDATNKFNQTVTASTETFNTNAEQKTNDFNDNASEKTDTFNANVDSSVKNFNDNASEKMSLYNENATGKVNEYNNNHSTKLKAYNDNDTLKTDNYNKNTVTKTTEYDTNHTNKINTYNSNASNKVDTYDANAEAKLAEYNANAEEKIADYDEHSEALSKQIVSTRNELERVKNDVLETGEETDTFIHLEDSAMAELQELKVEGVCEQTTTKGTNLFDVSKVTNKLVLDDGSMTDNASWNMSDYISVDSNTAYTASHKDTTSTQQSFILSEFDENKKIIKRNVQGVTSKNSYTITTSATTKYIIFNYNSAYNNSMLQVEKGSTTTDYEPYTGGMASPNPDYPQEIETITDGLNITSCGKNLIYMKDGTYVNNALGLTITIKENVLSLTRTDGNAQGGSIVLADGLFGRRNYLNYDLNLAPGGRTYILKVIVIDDGGIEVGSDTAGYISVYVNKGFNNYEVINVRTVGTFVKNVVLKKNEHIYNITVYSQYIICKNLKIKIQLEQANSATAYEEYVSSQIQANLPESEFIGKTSDTNKDTLNVKYNQDDGQYHLILNKMIGKKIINKNTGTVTKLADNYFGIDGAIENFLHYGDLTIDNNKTNKYVTLAQTSSNSQFLNISKDYNYAMNFTSSSFNNIRIKDIRFNTVDEFKQSLNEKPMEVYYLLDLNSRYSLDLGVIDMPLTYNEITNIFTDSELMPNINAKYYRNFTKTVQNLQVNNKALKEELIDINTRLSALEAKSAEEPSESEVQNDIREQ